VNLAIARLSPNLEMLNLHPVKYQLNLFLLNICNIVKMIWCVLPLSFSFIKRGKQALNPNDQNLQKCLEHLNFGIGICLEFIALSLEFESIGL
jgi:hypothetical protein